MTLASAPSVTDWIGAIGSGATALIALAALLFAVFQLRESKATRQLTRDLDTARSQPYVVMFMEPNAVGQGVMDLVVRNFGATAARDVVVKADPELRRAATAAGRPAAAELVLLPAKIPLLAPGQEWRIMWDIGWQRKDSGLPDYHEGHVTYSGIDGASLTSDCVLDWAPHMVRRWVEAQTIHDAAKALKAIGETLSKWSEPRSGGLNVTSRSGEAKDQAERREYEAWLRARKDPISPRPKRRR